VNTCMRCLEFPVPSHFLHLLQFPADYHVISISGSVIQLSPENLMNATKYCTMRRPKTKRLSASGGSPQSPYQGLCPWTPLGAPPSHPRYRLALPRSPYLGAPLKFVLAPLGLKFWRRRCLKYVLHAKN